jgi:hypothetical protein
MIFLSTPYPVGELLSFKSLNEFIDKTVLPTGKTTIRALMSSLVLVAKCRDSPQSREERKGFTLGLLCVLCASAVNSVLSQQELA